MLLPEPNRSGLPFVVSVTVQCSLVLLLAIPWTVQKIRNNASLQMLTMPSFQTLKPAEPVRTVRTRELTHASLSMAQREVRVFELPAHKSALTSPALPPAPDIGFESGAPAGFGATMSVPGIFAAAPRPDSVAPANVQGTPETHLVTVGGVVQAAKLIHQVQPIYPSLARQIRVQGAVTLEAIIGTDGTIQQLHVLSGHPLLAASAMEAVQKWRYRPTVLNNRAVEVKTTIEVRFTLS